MIQQMSLSLELIKPGICCGFLIRHRTWSCARTQDEGGLSPTLNCIGAGNSWEGELTQTHTHTTSNDLFASPATKNRKRFWGEPASEILTSKKPHKRLQRPDLENVCVYGRVCLWVCVHAFTECMCVGPVGHACIFAIVYACICAQFQVASLSYTRDE